jgi:predicted ATPase
VLVVATYRADELHRRHPLRPLLAELERMSGSARVELSPLTREELAVQLGELLGAPPDEELVDRVLARSEGYPLFVEELIAASADARGSLPSTLRDALMLRVERLSAAAQAVMRVLAVGQRLVDEVLAEVTGLESEALQGALREGVASHILAVADEGGYRFRHALLREVVGDDLLSGERAAIDSQLARALEARAERDGMSAYLAAAIANHFAAAGDRPAALRAAVRAAARPSEYTRTVTLPLCSSALSSCSIACRKLRRSRGLTGGDPLASCRGSSARGWLCPPGGTHARCARADR